MRLMPYLLSVPMFLACQPDIPNIQEQIPEIAAPSALDFGDQPVTFTIQGAAVVHNAGTAPLEVTARLEGPDAAFFSLPETTFTVDRKDAYDLAVAFSPGDTIGYDAQLVLESNDEDDPSVMVPLLGRGVPAPVPDIELSAKTLQFGSEEAPLEAPTILPVEIENVGLEPLILGTVQQSGSGRFDMTFDPSGTTIAPGDSYPLYVTYTPSTDPKAGILGDDGTIVIPSNDPDEPELSVVLLGNGGADYDYPVAAFDCPTMPVDPPTFLSFDAFDSFDPEGHEPLSYAWTLADQPQGSSAYLTSASGEQTSVWVDAAGTYALELSVTNAIDTVSAPLRCEFEARPEEAIHVELSWDGPSSDLDLHIAQEGFGLFELPGDANWCNEQPDWGQSGTSDNPRLDLDDRAGFGPENIVIPTPADDTYTVRVHYFDNNNDGDVTATVRIFLNGTLAFTDSQLLSLDDVWEVAEIAWPLATAGALSTPLESASHSSCHVP